MKAILMLFPFSVLIGIFCKFGLFELNLPVKVDANAYDVWTRPVLFDICSINESVYVDLSFDSYKRIDNIHILYLLLNDIQDSPTMIKKGSSVKLSYRFLV